MYNFHQIVLAYQLDDRGGGVRFPAWAGNFSFHHSIQTGSEAHRASYPVDTKGSFLGVKRPGREADSSPPSSAEASGTILPNTHLWLGAQLKISRRMRYTHE
jgi:hypothetical protein